MKADCKSKYISTCELDEARERFLESLKVRRYAEATVQSRANALTNFYRFLGAEKIGDVRAVTRETIRRYQLHLHERGLSESARLNYLDGLRRFFAHLEETDAILVNPCAGLVVPAASTTKLPRAILTPKQAQRMLAQPDVQTKTGLRDRAIMEVLYSTGLRRQEVASLSVYDVDLAQGCVRVRRGKGQKDRLVPLGKKACAAIQAYLQHARLSWSKTQTDAALWLRNRPPHAPLEGPGLWHRLRHYARMAGIPAASQAHVWRHTCATHLVSRGANIAYVQRILGHRTLQTTQIYTRVAPREVVATFRRAHPRAKLS
jgi:integrase/recombinase XerD